MPRTDTVCPRASAWTAPRRRCQGRTTSAARLIQTALSFSNEKPSPHPMTPRRKHPVHMPIVERSNELSIVFLTVCTIRRKRILAVPEVVQLLAESWPQATSWTVGKYLVMPDHI